MSYTAPSGNAVNISFVEGYTAPVGSAADFSFANKFSIYAKTDVNLSVVAYGDGAFSASSQSSAVWFSPFITVSIVGGTTLTPETSHRDVSLQTNSSVNIVLASTARASLSVEAGSALGVVGGTYYDASFLYQCGTQVTSYGVADARAKIRSYPKSKTSFKAAYEIFSAFKISGGAVLLGSSPSSGNMRVRARSRTIMRFRSGPWPW